MVLKLGQHIQAAGRFLPERLYYACEVRREAHQPLMGNSKIGPSVNLVVDDKENQALIEPVNGDEVKPNDGAFDVSWVHQSVGSSEDAVGETISIG